MRQRRKTRLSTCFLPGKMTRKIPFTISSISVNSHVHQPTNVLRFLQNDREISSESLHSQVRRNGGLEKNAPAAYRFFGRLGMRVWV